MCKQNFVQIHLALLLLTLQFFRGNCALLGTMARMVAIIAYYKQLYFVDSVITLSTEFCFFSGDDEEILERLKDGQIAFCLFRRDALN